MQFVQVKAARFPQTSQSGSALGGGREDAADERPEAAGAVAAAGEGGVSGGDARRVETVNEDASVVDGDGALAAPAFFPPLFFFGMTIEVGRVGWDERMSSSRGCPLHG